MTGLVIGDDHSVFLDAMSAVLEQRGYEVTVARSVPETIETVRRTQPDVCLIDRNFAGDDGITAISPMLTLTGQPDQGAGNQRGPGHRQGSAGPCRPGRPATCIRPGGYPR